MSLLFGVFNQLSLDENVETFSNEENTVTASLESGVVWNEADNCENSWVVMNSIPSCIEIGATFISQENQCIHSAATTNSAAFFREFEVGNYDNINSIAISMVLWSFGTGHNIVDNINISISETEFTFSSGVDGDHCDTSNGWKTDCDKIYEW